jgi:hypothetical protein
MKYIYIYIHISTIGSWIEILENIMDNIKHSGLYDKVKKIKCYILGNFSNIPLILQDDKIIIHKNNNLNLYERFTLNNLYDDSIKEDFYCLYIHTKGVTKPYSLPVKDWREYLLYFNTTYFEKILEYLKKYDTVGAQLLNYGGIHYSGNFWWSKSSHIRNLKREIDDNYCSPEFWICSKKDHTNYFSLWRTELNLYDNRYPKENYVSKGLRPYEKNY